MGNGKWEMANAQFPIQILISQFPILNSEKCLVFVTGHFFLSCYVFHQGNDVDRIIAELLHKLSTNLM